MDEGSMQVTVGIDVGDKYSELCVLDATGEIVEQSRIRTSPQAMRRYFGKERGWRVALEAGTHSPWQSRLLRELGHEVIVANPRRLKLISQGDDKNDRTDAELLARLAKADLQLLSPLVHRGADTQAALSVLRSRVQLVRARTALVNHVRGSVKAMGHRMKGSSAEAFHRRAEELPEVLRVALLPVMECIEQLSARIRVLDAQVNRLCKHEYPQTATLMQVPGVGPVTALTFVLTLEDPQRFTRSRQVGAYLGLCPRRRQSSEHDPQLRISKRGDRELRRLLVTCAHYIVGPFGPDSELRRHGLKLAARGGKNAKKRAVVAVARKLAVLLHRLWLNGEAYERVRIAA